MLLLHGLLLLIDNGEQITMFYKGINYTAIFHVITNNRLKIKTCVVDVTNKLSLFALIQGKHD